MTGPSSCPDRHQLEQYRLGRIKGQEAEELEKHVGVCGSCQEAMRGLMAASTTGADPRGQDGTLHLPDWSAPRSPESLRRPGHREHSGREPAPLSAKIGRYSILEKLGAGGMGTVYKAHDSKLERPVAIKILPAGKLTDADAVARFQREARALAKLSHPGIIQAHDSGEEGNQHFLVMELVEGRSLSKELEERGKLPATVAAGFAHQAALALAHAHQNGLIHRDVKPSNLLVTGDGRVKLLDLGLARFLQDQIGEADLTRVGAGMGTPDYVAPEQIRDARTADLRSDIYGLGCTLYHLIAGRVPFPGSSLSEKAEAHENKEPTSLAELCPEMPGGLALIVERMMAKRPADRFQSMAEVAEALAPYVATASTSFRELRNTTTWDGSRLTTMTGLSRRQATRLPWLVAAAAMLALVALGAAGFGLGWFRGPEPELARGPGLAPPTDKGDEQKGDKKGAPKKDEPKSLPDDPNVLTVAKDAKLGARFATIGAALEAVKPGQTVRVLDDALYAETILLTQASLHAGITLEAPRGATLAPQDAVVSILIKNVPDVTVRGFRLRADSQGMMFVIGVIGRSPGVILEDLELSMGKAANVRGIALENLTAAAAPAVVRHCHFRRMLIGIRVAGLTPDSNNPVPCGGVILHDNHIETPMAGIMVVGAVSRVHVVGNRILGAGQAAIQLGLFFKETRDILVANNTIVESNHALQLWDDAKKGVLGENVQFRNNLILSAAEQDLRFSDHGGKHDGEEKGPGDGKLVLERWRLGFNWREVSAKHAKEPGGQGWVPPAVTDVRLDKIDGINRNPKSPDFLRPAKDSPLASKGAGQEDPSLPMYVGALPPAGTQSWDWDRTWRMPKDAQLLTVSKDAKDQAKYDSINAALKDAKPWATIRVLDAASYKEAVQLTDAKRFEGIVLEAVKGASLVLGPTTRRLLQIDSVPHVRVHGFRLRAEGNPGTSDFVWVTGRNPGLVLSGLDIRADVPQFCITLINVVSEPHEPPLTVRGCYLQNPGEGIRVIGPAVTATGARPTSGVAILDNHVSSMNYRGIVVEGMVKRILVAGNRVQDCKYGLQVEDLGAQSSQVAFLNNTSFGGRFSFRYWVSAHALPSIPQGQVELAGNLLFGAEEGDLALVYPQMNVTAADAKKVAAGWTFNRNARDLSGTRGPERLPLSPSDRKLETVPLISRDPASPEFLRPVKDSPLVTDAPGHLDPSLPRYIGAVPPEGETPWNWGRAWRMRMSKPGLTK